MLVIPNEIAAKIAINASATTPWLRQYVISYYRRSMIKAISVGTWDASSGMSGWSSEYELVHAVHNLIQILNDLRVSSITVSVKQKVVDTVIPDTLRDNVRAELGGSCGCIDCNFSGNLVRNYEH
ncbi:hypothetical protein Tco_1014117 [Tanacetum coccineum]